MGKKFSELERAVSLNNGDLAAFAQVDQSAATGYKSKAAPMSLVSQKILKETEYASDLQTDDKTVLGAINEVNSRTIAYDVVSGPIANFKTSLELPIKSLGIDVNAVQAAGTPSPDNPIPITGVSEITAYTMGKNLLSKSVGFFSTIPATLNEYFFIKAGTYIFSISSVSNATSWRFNLRMKDKNGNNLSDSNHQPNNSFVWNSSVEGWIHGANTTNLTAVFNIVEDCFIRITFSTGDTTAQTIFNEPMLEKGNTRTPYEPYFGDSIIVSLGGGTYYGGHFTQDKDGHRQFVVTSKFATFTGANNESWNDYPVGNGFFINLVTDHIIESYGDGKCNILPTSKTFSALGIVFGINSNYIFLMQVKNSWNISTLNELRDFLSVNNLQVVYTLAEPIVIDLPDGEPIITFNGINNIYADSGDASVEYALTIEEYIDKKIAELQALILNS